MFSLSRIGVFGGTFDPVHLGHLHVAKEVLKALFLDKIVFVPTNTQPYKAGTNCACPLDRYNMLCLAVQDEKKFLVSKVDIIRGGITYTVDTLKDIKKIYPKDELFFIVGMDCANEIKRWKNYDELIGMAKFVAVTRPSIKPLFNSSSCKRQANIEKDMLNCKRIDNVSNEIIILNIPNMDISSTKCRNAVKSGNYISDMVPFNVEKYIIEHNLYGTE